MLRLRPCYLLFSPLYSFITASVLHPMPAMRDAIAELPLIFAADTICAAMFFSDSPQTVTRANGYRPR